VFWDEEGKRAVTIIWFGDAVSGWPNTTHGGALSTIMDESLGRVALRSFPAGTGVTANLDINFRKPVRPGRWYVLYAQTREATERKATTVGRLEDIGGRVCVEAKGIFVVPKAMTLKKITGQF
jgi:acyl-coenzyme A thioesterase PaaI-like protein